MLQKVDLGDNRNLFTASVILVAGVGSFVLTIGKVTLTAVAVALILGIIVNFVCKLKKDEKPAKPAAEEPVFEEDAVEEEKAE